MEQIEKKMKQVSKKEIKDKVDRIINDEHRNCLSKCGYEKGKRDEPHCIVVQRMLELREEL